MSMTPDKRILNVKFIYEIQSNQVNCVVKWAGEAQYGDLAEISNLPRIPIEKRFFQSVIPRLHTIFVIDKSESMGSYSFDKLRRRYGLND
jgi:hypothetical protein